MSQQKQSNENNDYLDKFLEIWTAFVDQCVALVRRAIASVRQTGSEIKEGWQNFKTECPKKWKKFKAECPEKWKNFKAEIPKKWNNFKAECPKKWKNFKANCSKKWSNFKTKCPEKWNNFKTRTPEKWGNFKAKCGENWQKAKPYFKDAKLLFGKIGSILKAIFRWIWRLRKVFMAIPVVWLAVKFALDNANRLPEMVGLDLQSTGEFARMVSREVAVGGPLAITGFCLLLMFCSKKTLLPWLVSIFTLVLPWLIYLTNFYA